MKMISKKNKIYFIFFVQCVTILFLSNYLIYINSFDNNKNLVNNYRENLTYTDLISKPKLSAEIPNSKPLSISHHSTQKNEFLSKPLPTNISFTLVEDWVSKNSTIRFDDVYWKKDRIINGNFASTQSPWQWYARDTDIVNNGRQSGGYVQMEIRPTDVDIGDFGYYQETISISENIVQSKLATLSFDLYYQEEDVDHDFKLYMAVISNGVEKNNTISFLDIDNYNWIQYSMTYNPFQEGQTNLNNVAIRIGVIIDTFSADEGIEYVRFDNIAFNCWTEPNQANIITVKDIETSVNYPYQNLTNGQGKIFIATERTSSQTKPIIFTISKNVLNDLEANNITIESINIKNLNSTVSSIEGSKFTLSTDISWYAEWITIIPFNYLNNWIEIEKPTDWFITHILDGFNEDQAGHCLGVGLGSNRVIIPEAYVSSGLWKLEAVSQNYIDMVNVRIWNGTGFENSENYYVGDIFQINLKLNDSISFTNSVLNITIYHPNGSIFWISSQEPVSFNIILGNFIVGLNMSVGRYEVITDWRNSDTVEEIEKVGHLQNSFNIIHNSSLEAVESVIDEIAGEPLLMKVRFIDDDLNKFISFGSLNYYSSYGESGIMSYIGSGTYVADIDTSLLAESGYFFSFDTSTSYYENFTINNLITLNIILEPLELEVPRQVLSVISNSYALFQFNITGERFGAPISTNNVTTDWQKTYTITEHNVGNYTLNVSTYEVTSGDIPETFTIKITANKTNYGRSSDIVILTVYPIPTEVNLNVTLVEAYLNQKFFIRANYTKSDTGTIINEASCSVIWASEYQITPISNGFIIEFNATGLILDSYFVQVKFERLGYKTALKGFTLLLKPTISELTILNIQPMEFYKGDIVNISCSYLSEGADILNANLAIFGEFAGDFRWNGLCYNFEINTSNSAVKSYFVQILATSTNYQTQFKEIIFKISPLIVEIKTNNTITNYQQGIGNNFTLSIYDQSHNKLTIDLRVIYEYNGISGDLQLLPNGSFVLNLNDLNLSPNKQLYQIKIIVLNPYGNNDEIILNIIMPLNQNIISTTDENGKNNTPNTSEDTSIFSVLFLTLIVTSIGVLFGVFIKRRYFNFTKFQRDIRKLKTQLFKNKFEKIPKLTRDEVLNEMIKEKIISQNK